MIKLDGLQIVTDLRSARAAIAQIIEQGEGGRRARETSHYDRFCAIRAEYKMLRAKRATFDPAHLVAENPVMHQPIDSDCCALVCAPDATRCLDICNAIYGLMVQLLARFFGAMDGIESRRLLADAALMLMSRALAPVAQHLATLPIGDSRSGENAGLTFTLPRSTHALPQRGPAWTLLHERATQIAAACRSEPCYGVLDTVGEHVERVAETLRLGRDEAWPARL